MSDHIRFGLPFKTCQRLAVAMVLCAVAMPGITQAQQEQESEGNAQPRNAEAQTTTQNPEDLPPAKTDGAAPEKDSAQDVMNNLMGQMKNNPMIEPTTPAGQGNTPAGAGSAPAPATGASGAASPGQTAGVRVDPNIVGTAPGAEAPKLRREGEFVISRKGRLVRSGDGMHTLFVFDADSKDSPEAPMAVVPCQMLQSMEDLMGQRGDQIQFILSGQILVYRGVNYVLPTMMTLAEDRGNLQ